MNKPKRSVVLTINDTAAVAPQDAKSYQQLVELEDRLRLVGIRSGWEPKSQLWTKMYHFYALNRAEFLQALP